jgi:hypothetical protein
MRRNTAFGIHVMHAGDEPAFLLGAPQSLDESTLASGGVSLVDDPSHGRAVQLADGLLHRLLCIPTGSDGLARLLDRSASPTSDPQVARSPFDVLAHPFLRG